MTFKVKRGDIYFVDLGEEKFGSEQKGKRPALILQNNTGNHHSTTTIVALISTKKKPLPVHIYLDPEDSGLQKDSYVLLEQLRTIDKQRLLKRIGSTSDEKMEEVQEAIKISLGMVNMYEN